MDRVLSYGAEGFDRMVNLSVLALNVHRVGLTEFRRLQEERKKEEKATRTARRLIGRFLENRILNSPASAG